MLKRSRILANFDAFERRTIASDDYKLAAVALILCPNNDECTFILTNRSANLNRNAGNYALPGGRIDSEDAHAIATAIRETQEEVGIVLTEADVVGQLDDFITLTGYRVTPIVFWLQHAVTPVPNPDEVAEVLHIPLSDLTDPASLRLKEQDDGGEAILQLRVQGRWINPPTAAWLYQFLEVGLRGNEVRVDKLRQPDWTAF